MIGAALAHDALFYSSDASYIEAIDDFARRGLDDGASVLIAVPGPRLDVLRPALASLDGRLAFADMTQAGRNPARIIPFITAFLDANAGTPVRFVGEPIWAGRSGPEVVECVRHEALLNAAFANSHVHILCPYDERGLEPAALEDARKTHPTFVCCGIRQTSATYVDPLLMYAATDRPLPEPRVAPAPVPLEQGLGRFRESVEARGRSAGLAPGRLMDFVIAANEAAANTLVHAAGRGAARIWHDDHDLVCEISDRGRIDDPLVGRRVPPTDREGGRGVWLINQLCDLVELRSGPAGTVIRIHMHLS